MGVSGSSFMVNSHGHCWKKKEKGGKKGDYMRISVCRTSRSAAFKSAQNLFPTQRSLRAIQNP